MSDVRFHATRMGQRFYEHTLPRLVEELAKLIERLAALEGALAQELDRWGGRPGAEGRKTDEPPAQPGGPV